MKCPKERKEAILKKMLPPHHKSIDDIAKEKGISEATLYNWRQSARSEGRLLPAGNSTPSGWTAADKFAAVVVLAHEQEQFAAGITHAEATELLRKDVRIAERAVLMLISVPLTDGQFDALVSFTFNLSAGAMQRSTLRRKVNRREHEDVPEELRKWVRSNGKRLRGLIIRRREEAFAYSELRFEKSKR